MDYVLGLDLGARSVGWALIELQGDEPKRVVAAGVRVFEAGAEGNIEEGREESRGVKRRQARLARRQTRRRRQRLRQLYRELAGAGLLPAVQASPGRPFAVAVQEAINVLDGQCRLQYQHDPCANRIPYLLRARALDEPLAPWELGRVFYHIGQRRGFKSNRKAEARDPEERSLVYDGIRRLEEEIQRTGARTLGEYLSKLDPRQERIRCRYTQRSMYEREFDAIWAAQSPHHPCLTTELRERLAAVLFSQRPLKDGAELVGSCSWDPSQKRAPAWSLEYQRFRVLQEVAHLRYADESQVWQPLDAEQRSKLVAALSTTRELDFRAIRKLLGFAGKVRFSVEAGGEKKLRGNVVAAEFIRAIGEEWNALGAERQAELVRQVALAEDDDKLREELITNWRLTPEQAGRLVADVRLPRGYAALSLKAIRAALPYLEQGMSVQQAREAAGYELMPPVPARDLLPPLASSGIEVFNPAVKRSLTELRKVVNAVVRKYGKPAEIHIEVARELRKSREERQKESRRMREREAERERMRQKIHKEVGIPLEQIREEDVRKGLLYEECCRTCPYTGKPLGGFAGLFSGTSPVQIEHIIPYSISLDDSFANLTLCLASENAVKHNRTPYQAYSADPGRWEDIQARVRAFRGPYAAEKLRRFLMDEQAAAALLQRFSARHLNDTRYAAVVAGRYLSLLYGGEVIDGKRKILKVTGQITAHLRRVWGMNEILGRAGVKSRDDHRQHAIDAALVAVADQRSVQRLSQAAARAELQHRRRLPALEPPFVGFKEGLQCLVQTMNISFRPDHRVSGPLHKETFYAVSGAPAAPTGTIRTRKPVFRLTEEDVDRIADPAVRCLVKQKLAGVGEARKLEKDWPVLPNAHGQPVPIKRVRLELRDAVRAVGQGHRRRWAEVGESHHVAVFEVTKRSRQGTRTAWEGEVVSLWEALERLRLGKPVIDRAGGPDRRFLFSLCKNDTLQLNGPRPGIYVVRKIRQNKQITLVPQHDARPEKQREQFSPTVSGLLEYAARKVVVTPLGELVESHE